MTESFNCIDIMNYVQVGMAEIIWQYIWNHFVVLLTYKAPGLTELVWISLRKTMYHKKKSNYINESTVGKVLRKLYSIWSVSWHIELSQSGTQIELIWLQKYMRLIYQHNTN